MPLPTFEGMGEQQLTDSFGRKINYLRLSVTDECNFSCRYCRAEDYEAHARKSSLLDYDDLHLLAKVSVSTGIEKIRITGGEPLVRSGLPRFLDRLSRIEGLKALVLTTNGTLLSKMAEELRASGVSRVNISIDSLKPGNFSSITGGGKIDFVMRGIEAAERAGFQSIKLNMVVMKGVNDEEILDFARLTIDKNYEVRFIEYMPVFGVRGWPGWLVTGKEILDTISAKYDLEPSGKHYLQGPSRTYRIEGASGKIGVITPLSCSFCDDCNRIRVSSDGIVRTCLLSDGGFDIKPAIRSGDENRLKYTLQNIVEVKPRGHVLSPERPSPLCNGMIKMGG